MKFEAIKFVLLALSAILVLSPPSAGFGVSSAVLEEEVSPGQELHYAVSISAGEDETLQNMTANIYGFAMTQDAINIELSPEDDTGSYSARPFLSVDPQSFSVDPGERETLLLTGTIPEDAAPGGRYALVTISTAPEATEGAQVMVMTAIQIAVYLTVTGSDLAMTGDISDLAASMADGNVSIDLLYENTGNVHYKPLVGANLLDEDGKVVASVAPAETRRMILPTGSRLVSMTLVPDALLEPGTYTVEATVALDDGTVLDTAETTIEV